MLDNCSLAGFGCHKLNKTGSVARNLFSHTSPPFCFLIFILCVTFSFGYIYTFTKLHSWFYAWFKNNCNQISRLFFFLNLYCFNSPFTVLILFILIFIFLALYRLPYSIGFVPFPSWFPTATLMPDSCHWWQWKDLYAHAGAEPTQLGHTYMLTHTHTHTHMLTPQGSEVQALLCWEEQRLLECSRSKPTKLDETHQALHTSAGARGDLEEHGIRGAWAATGDRDP